MRAIHQLGGGFGAFLDLPQTFAHRLIKRLVVEHQAHVAVEKRQDVVHPVRQSANELILILRLFDLHGVPVRKAECAPRRPAGVQDCP